MAGNSFGDIFRITTFGESHGVALGVIIDGCPAGLKIDTNFIQQELDRRKPGQSSIVTQRKEADEFEILSGIFEGVTQGTPIGIIIRNEDQKSKDYEHIKDNFRPSHADYTYHEKYGVRDIVEVVEAQQEKTAVRVAAAAIAKQLLKNYGIEINAYVSRVGEVAVNKHYTELDFSKIEDTIVRCPDAVTAEKMIDLIKEVKKEGDTIGGWVSCVIKGMPVGLGEPVFDRLHADLGKAMLSINAAKGFEYGSGFDGVTLRGSQHNDAFYNDNGIIKTKTNHSGGIQGGISNGMDIYFNVAFKPVATIVQAQESVDKDGSATVVTGRGRHDPCVLPRAVPIVEAMAALVIADHLLRNRSSKL